MLWFEPPTVVGWDEEHGYWTTEDYHDIKFNEEKQVGPPHTKPSLDQTVICVIRSFHFNIFATVPIC